MKIKDKKPSKTLFTPCLIDTLTRLLNDYPSGMANEPFP
jgi:hypothetical protein